MTSQLGSTPADLEVVAAARVLLQRMGVDPADLMAQPQQRRPVPTFADYIPIVEAAVSAGTARTYRSYWNRIAAKWGSRTLLEPTPSEISQFREEIKASAVVRRNSRGGRNRCMSRFWGRLVRDSLSQLAAPVVCRFRRVC